MDDPPVATASASGCPSPGPSLPPTVRRCWPAANQAAGSISRSVCRRTRPDSNVRDPGGERLLPSDGAGAWRCSLPPAGLGRASDTAEAQTAALSLMSAPHRCPSTAWMGLYRGKNDSRIPSTSLAGVTGRPVVLAAAGSRRSAPAAGGPARLSSFPARSRCSRGYFGHKSSLREKVLPRSLRRAGFLAELPAATVSVEEGL